MFITTTWYKSYNESYFYNSEANYNIEKIPSSKDK